MKNYVVVTEYEGETFMSIKTEKELAERWEYCDIACVDEPIKAWEYIDGKMTEVDVDKIAHEYLNDRAEMQKEYEEYTEYVNEYGHEPCNDFYEDQDSLEMGFDPYMGCYSDDC